MIKEISDRAANSNQGYISVSSTVSLPNDTSCFEIGDTVLISFFTQSSIHERLFISLVVSMQAVYMMRMLDLNTEKIFLRYIEIFESYPELIKGGII